MNSTVMLWFGKSTVLQENPTSPRDGSQILATPFLNIFFAKFLYLWKNVLTDQIKLVISFLLLSASYLSLVLHYFYPSPSLFTFSSPLLSFFIFFANSSPSPLFSSSHPSWLFPSFFSLLQPSPCPLLFRFSLCLSSSPLPLTPPSSFHPPFLFDFLFPFFLFSSPLRYPFPPPS